MGFTVIISWWPEQVTLYICRGIPFATPSHTLWLLVDVIWEIFYTWELTAIYEWKAEPEWHDLVEYPLLCPIMPFNLSIAFYNILCITVCFVTFDVITENNIKVFKISVVLFFTTVIAPFFEIIPSPLQNYFKYSICWSFVTKEKMSNILKSF